MFNIRNLEMHPYELVWQEMKHFTLSRHHDTQDELWMLEHPNVYTLGQAGKREHILNATNIPVIQSDRGGQVTYHGPGQLVGYVLMDLRRKQMGIRTLVCRLEQVLITVLKRYEILGDVKCGAPGVYVDGKKIASIGLRVKNGCTYHGIALNVDMDLMPFTYINPCGYTNLQMTQIKDYFPEVCLEQVKNEFVQDFLTSFES